MMFWVGLFVRRLCVGFALGLGIILISLSWSGAATAAKLVDPDSVAPEYREAAEKRRAEQIKQAQCAKKADEAKVLRRDRVAYINQCLDR